MKALCIDDSILRVLQASLITEVRTALQEQMISVTVMMDFAVE